MARTSALRRAAAPLLAALQQQQSQAAAAAPRALHALTRAAVPPAGAPAPHPPACACGPCAALRAAPRCHRAGCGCGRCGGALRGAGAGSTGTITFTPPGGARGFSQCSCPGLDVPPPDRVVIEYDPEDVDMYIQIADAIEEAYPNIVVEGNVESDGRKGAFEITAASGQLLFSRLAAGGAAPQPAAIVAALGAAGAEGGECAVTPGGAQQ